jgi:hypothetical protein
MCKSFPREFEHSDGWFGQQTVATTTSPQMIIAHASPCRIRIRIFLGQVPAILGRFTECFQFKFLMSLGSQVLFDTVTPSADALTAESTNEDTNKLTIPDDTPGGKVDTIFRSVFVDALTLSTVALGGATTVREKHARPWGSNVKAGTQQIT